MSEYKDHDIADLLYSKDYSQLSLAEQQAVLTEMTAEEYTRFHEVLLAETPVIDSSKCTLEPSDEIALSLMHEFKKTSPVALLPKLNRKQLYFTSISIAAAFVAIFLTTNLFYENETYTSRTVNSVVKNPDSPRQTNNNEVVLVEDDAIKSTINTKKEDKNNTVQNIDLTQHIELSELENIDAELMLLSDNTDLLLGIDVDESDSDFHYYTRSK